MYTLHLTLSGFKLRSIKLSGYIVLMAEEQYPQKCLVIKSERKNILQRKSADEQK
jgi:hypothetical protein